MSVYARRWPNIGELDRRVTIRRWTDQTNADFGIDQAVDYGQQRWAKIEPVMGVAYWGNKQTGEEVTHKIWLRYGEGTKPEQITGQHVVDHVSENRRYRVVRATHAADAREFTVLECKVLGAIT